MGLSPLTENLHALAHKPRVERDARSAQTEREAVEGEGESGEV